MGKIRAKTLLTAAAEHLDLPADIVAGQPRLEIIGRNEVRMEHHRGILSYGEHEISVSGGDLLVRIQGEQLRLRAMSADALLISGELHTICLE